jgi:hypothetical protein
VLIDADPLPADTAVLFDVALSGGQKPIRAEGRVIGSVAPTSDRPGGLRVRFKRFGAATKAFIERAVKAQSEAQPPELVVTTPVPREPSGVRARRPGPVAAPANREELLERLRRRRRTG